MSETMLDYIHEQPEAAKRVFLHRKEDALTLKTLLEEKHPNRIFLIGSGSSFNAAKVAAPVMERLLKIEVTPVASSAIYALYNSNPILIFVSQGGNSTNTVRAIRELSSYPHMALTGSPNCMINDLTDHVLIRCGEEKAGPKTKGYVSTIIALVCMAIETAWSLHIVTNKAYQAYIREWEKAIAGMDNNIQRAAEWMEMNQQEMSKIEKCVVIGKHIGHAAALESALKLQETMLIPASGYEFEEFLHGPDMALDEKMAGLYLMPEQNDLDYRRFLALVHYHRTRCPMVYTVGGGRELQTVRDLPIGSEDLQTSKVLSWCLPSQFMGAKLPSLMGREERGIDIFRELDEIVSIKAKYKAEL